MARHDQYGSDEASALVIGAGGLGAPALLALAAAGVRRLGVMDPDRVEISNLHRQILYRERDIGRPKAECAKEALERRFPGLSVEAFSCAFEERTHDCVRSFGVVLDGTDLFDAKIAISDACVDRGVRYVFAGVVAYEGQVMAVDPSRSACLRCLFDEAPPAGGAPTCAEIGVVGPVAGITGARQATAALALLAGDHEVLDRIWIYDGKRDRARVVSVRRASDCKGCGSRRDQRAAAAAWGGGRLDDPSSAGASLVDLSGLACPATYVETRKALARLPEHGRVWILLTSDEAARNIPRSAIAAGHRVLSTQSDGRTHRLLLERGDGERL